MEKQKYYAVAKGRKTGVFSSWSECKSSVHGFKGAVFKSFSSLEEAKDYLEKHSEKIEYIDIDFEGEYLFEGDIPIPVLSKPLNTGDVIVYVDGSVNKEKGKVGFGYIVYYEDKIYPGYGYKEGKDYLSMLNVSGEILSVINAFEVIDTLDGVERIEIRYDYKGIEDWSTKAWSAKKPITAMYADLMDIVMKSYNGNVVFKHIDGHTGEPGNEAVDILAKTGCGVV